METTDDVRVVALFPISSPSQLKQDLPITESAATTVLSARKTIENIISKKDDRLLVIAGPCSIHDPTAAMEYACKLRNLQAAVIDKVFLVMRVYFEKPRTTIGWKGLISDPHLNGTDNIEEGLRIARQLLLDINQLGLPAATEFLDPTIPQFISDLVSWAAIGARTTESQTHREMASGLSMPVGFKNGTSGTVQIAINAMMSARTPHSFLGIDQEGRQCKVATKGNPWGHLILRGGADGPNYDPKHVTEAVTAIRSLNLDPAIVIDCSHDNGRCKKPEKNTAVWSANSETSLITKKTQSTAWYNVLTQRRICEKTIIGAMLESNLLPGQQKISAQKENLRYGVSITDECISWEETEDLILATKI